MTLINKKNKPVLKNITNLLIASPLILFVIVIFVNYLSKLIFKKVIIGSNEYVIHLVLAFTFIGGILSSIRKEHLSLSSLQQNLSERLQSIFRFIRTAIGVSILFSFFIASLYIFLTQSDKKIGALPIQIFTIFMPIGFLAMCVLQIFENKQKIFRVLCACAGLTIGLILSSGNISNIIDYYGNGPSEFFYNLSDSVYVFFEKFYLLGLLVLVGAAFLGMPLFIALGGIGAILLLGAWWPIDTAVDEGYKLLINNSIPSIPLFTLVGYLLSESKASSRLIKLFQAWLGWLPGGSVFLSVIVCAFFTTFTGASGVTILAFGALLLNVLHESGQYSLNFSRGLITSSGSIGLLFPPSLPIILYAVVAQINMKHMFIGGIIPGVIMVLALSLAGFFYSLKKKTDKIKFSIKAALKASLDAIFELLLPVIIFTFYLFGLTSLIETAAVALIYTFIILTFVKKDIQLNVIPQILVKAIGVIGGILIILMAAKSLNFFISISGLPDNLTLFLEEHVHSKYLFLLLLNIALLITGCLMDIFSAIAVVVPLIIPLGALYGIHPVHLGIIFLANLELGYLTPPVGLNLFLASYRFKTPLIKIYKDVAPFLLILFGALLLITYFPFLSTILVPG